MEEHMGDIKNKERRHLTWPELREKYAAAETFEEKLGLIHAARTAVIVEDSFEFNLTIVCSPTKIAGINFLTMIGNETGVLMDDGDAGRECDHRLRRDARIALARHFMNLGWTPHCDSPTPTTRRRSAPAGAIEAGGWGTSDPESRVGRDAIVRLARFYGLTAKHLNGLDDACRQDVRHFFQKRWEYQFSNEQGFVPRAALIAATMHLRAYEFFAQHVVLDAIPVLYKGIATFVNEWRKADGEAPYADTLREYRDRHLSDADLRHALIVCAEVLDNPFRSHPSDALATLACIDVSAQAQVLLALLAHHERAREQPTSAAALVAQGV